MRLSDLERELVVAVNQQRVRRGLVPLRISRQLSVAARGHSLSMAEHGFFAHESYDGSAFWVRIKACTGPPRPSLGRRRKPGRALPS